MATVLVIKAHPQSDTASTSLSIGDQFIQSYKEANPQDEILVHDLYKEGTIEIDSSNFNVWKKLSLGTKFDELSPEEHILISRQQLLQKEFMQADKYIFINPMYNLFLPARLKSYLDVVCLSTKTWSFTDGGLLKDKIAMHIQTSSGIYHTGEDLGNIKNDIGDGYLRAILAQMGVTDVHGIYCEGLTGQNPEADLQNKLGVQKLAAMEAQEF